MRERMDLNGDYLLLCMENKKVRALASLPVTLEALRRAEGLRLTGKVPGNFELDLYREGYIEDPFYGTNVWKLQKLESMHLFYGRTFILTRREANPVLVLEGVDTVAEIFLNGEKIADCRNMFLIHEIPVPGIREGENELVVHILPACIEARRYPLSAANTALKYNYEALRLRKSAAMFSWDIMPRIVSGGLWRPVYLESRPIEYIRQAYLMTLSVDTEENTACLQLFFDTFIESDDLSGYRIRVEGRHGDSRFVCEDRLWFVTGKLDFQVTNPDFWWPRGYGEPCLYRVEISLLKDGQTVDSRSFEFGIRTVALDRGRDRFEFLVNGKKIFLLGTNFVPIDAFHSRDRERLPRVMELLRDSGCNAVRIWGGGVYEDDFLYEECDRMGILVWQDFMMACGIYPTDPEFCQVMRQEATQVIRRLRQHPCLLLWAGDNECDFSAAEGVYRRNPDRNRITREILRDAAEFEDPVRPYLPSSPFYGKDYDFLPEDHLWGPRDYYKSSYYTQASCLFVSEIGYHGCVSKKSMEKFIPPDFLRPGQRDAGCWTAHAASPESSEKASYSYRIRLMATQIRNLFGQIPEDLDDFILASQITQAEALKFFIEKFRLDPGRTGIIWWNLIDGWPQFSDAVVDYYFEKKLAFYYIQRAQQPLLVSMRESGDGLLTLVFRNDTGSPCRLRVKLMDYMDGDRLLWEGDVTAAAKITEITELECRPKEQKIYRVEWEGEGISGENHYLAGEPPFSLQMYKAFLENKKPSQ